MIDREEVLPITRQAQVLDLSRSSVYYQPVEVSQSDLTLMRRIDELHLEHPFAGSRMLKKLLRADGFSVGRTHVRTLMRRMGLKRSTDGLGPPSHTRDIGFFHTC